MKTLLDHNGIDQTLRKLAREIAAAAPTDVPVAVVGIRRRGETLAERLIPLIAAEGIEDIRHGALDITLYRDDLTTIGPHATVRKTEIDFDINDMWVVLVDDVLYTGRSVRAALDAVIDLGRPRAVDSAPRSRRVCTQLPAASLGPRNPG